VNGVPPTGPDGKKLLTGYLVPFSRGARSCLGIPLAYAELYICLANLIRKCKLYETTEADVGFDSEFVAATSWPGSKGVRALVH
jgi:cytochrome P450